MLQIVVPHASPITMTSALLLRTLQLLLKRFFRDALYNIAMCCAVSCFCDVPAVMIDSSMCVCVCVWEGGGKDRFLCVACNPGAIDQLWGSQMMCSSHM